MVRWSRNEITSANSSLAPFLETIRWEDSKLERSRCLLDTLYAVIHLDPPFSLALFSLPFSFFPVLFFFSFLSFFFVVLVVVVSVRSSAVVSFPLLHLRSRVPPRSPRNTSGTFCAAFDPFAICRCRRNNFIYR